jgi:PadR family transcriptional regulator PadR
MLNTINSDLIRGHINTIILKALFEGDRYGYDIVKEIEQKSSGQYKLKQPTLYSCLKRLEIQGFIRSYWGAKTSGGRRKYYTLTDMGRELFIKNQSDWEYSRTVINKLISDKEYDLSQFDSDGEDAPESESEADEFTEPESPLMSPGVAETAPEAASTDKTAPEQFADGDAQNAPEQFADTDAQNAAEPFADVDAEASPDADENEKDDASSVLDELFNSQSGENSYAQKLAAERVKIETNQADASRPYFKDFLPDAAPETETDAETETEAGQAPAETAPGQNAAPEASRIEFLSYHTKPAGADAADDKKIIEREYRNVLGKLVKKSGSEYVTEEHEPEKSESVFMESNLPALDPDKSAAAILSGTGGSPSVVGGRSARDYGLGENLSRLSESTLLNMGDSVKTRLHNDSGSVYNARFRYFSNKLMLVQYAVLFGIMLAEIIFTFLFVKTGLKIHQSFDIYTYIIAVAVAVAFPVAAAIMNFSDPAKIKTLDFDLRNSLVFRFWIAACCAIIIYCANMFMGMPISLSTDYLSTLILPMLFALDCPVSAIIFYLLHGTGKYSPNN